MATLTRFYLTLEAMVRWASNLLLVMLLGVVLAAVVVRYFGLLGGSLAWSDEFGRFSMVWIAMLGSVIAFDRGQHLAISVLPSSLSGWPARLVQIVINLLCAVFLAALAWQSLILSERTMRQLSPALGLPFGFVYLSMAIGSLLILVQMAIFTISPSLKLQRISRHSGELDL